MESIGTCQLIGWPLVWLASLGLSYAIGYWRGEAKALHYAVYRLNNLTAGWKRGEPLNNKERG